MKECKRGIAVTIVVGGLALDSELKNPAALRCRKGIRIPGVTEGGKAYRNRKNEGSDLRCDAPAGA